MLGWNQIRLLQDISFFKTINLNDPIILLIHDYYQLLDWFNPFYV